MLENLIVLPQDSTCCRSWWRLWSVSGRCSMAFWEVWLFLEFMLLYIVARPKVKVSFKFFMTLLNMIDAACELSMKDFYSRNLESFSMCACRNHYKIDSCTKCLKSIVSKKTIQCYYINKLIIHLIVGMLVVMTLKVLYYTFLLI